MIAVDLNLQTMDTLDTKNRNRVRQLKTENSIEEYFHAFEVDNSDIGVLDTHSHVEEFLEGLNVQRS